MASTTRNNPLETLLGYRLRRASSSLMADLARDLAAIGFRPAEASVVILIATNPGITQSEIGRILGIQRANMAPLTAGLERRGLLARERVDGRSHGLIVTEDGAEAGRQAEAAMRAHDKRAFGALAAADHAVLTNALIKLRGNDTI